MAPKIVLIAPVISFRA